jgi:hypothetical protein
MYSYTILDSENFQVRVSVDEFRGSEYLSIRKYYMDFDGEWAPTKDGISVPLTIDTTTNLFKAIANILSQAETNDILHYAISRLSSETVL